jgi:hypothetical protein
MPSRQAAVADAGRHRRSRPRRVHSRRHEHPTDHRLHLHDVILLHHLLRRRVAPEAACAAKHPRLRPTPAFAPSQSPPAAARNGGGPEDSGPPPPAGACGPRRATCVRGDAKQVRHAASWLATTSQRHPAASAARRRRAAADEAKPGARPAARSCERRRGGNGGGRARREGAAQSRRTRHARGPARPRTRRRQRSRAPRN